jgi:hypothetical protein
VPDTKFHGNPSSESRDDTYEQTDGRTGRQKDGRTGRQKDGRAGRQKDGRAGRQKDGRTGREKDGRTNSLMPFQSMRALLWRFSVVGKNKTYLAFRIKCPIFLPKFNQFRISSTDFHKSLGIIFHGNPSSGAALIHADRRTWRRS